MSTTATPHAVSINPVDGSEIDRFPHSDGAEIEAALDRAREKQRSWGRLTPAERGEAMRRIGDELLASRDELAATVTAEMGKTLAEARAEVEKCARACSFYADEGPAMLAAEAVDAVDGGERFVEFPPLGVVLAIMPWNYPIWQVVRAMAPALLAGNTMVLKHASNVTGSALRLGEIVARAEPSLLEVLVVPGGKVAPLIADPRIAAVTLTGSEAVGVEVAKVCAHELKKSVLELGGSDPFVILADADVERAAEVARTARFQNAGQSCIAAKRFIVVESVAERFEAAFTSQVEGLTVGDPLAEATDLGPMARADLRDELAEQVQRSLEAGGRLLTGGAAGQTGAFYEPTLVADVELSNPLAQEETFGPAAAIISVADEDAAIAAANATAYGLSSSLWTEDLDRARALAPRIEAGGVFVNTMTASDPPMPFGGVKRSGWGRELGRYGLREFVNVQAVTIAG